MTNLEHYLQDGANYQARAVLMILQSKSNIQPSWNDERKEYDAEIKVARWENCREQGYIVSLRNAKGKQLNIAFFEHRNTDSICAIKWEQQSINSLSMANAEFKDIYKDKWDVSCTVDVGGYDLMADWIIDELTAHWNKSK